MLIWRTGSILSICLSSQDPTILTIYSRSLIKWRILDRPQLLQSVLLQLLHPIDLARKAMTFSVLRYDFCWSSKPSYPDYFICLRPFDYPPLLQCTNTQELSLSYWRLCTPRLQCSSLAFTGTLSMESERIPEEMSSLILNEHKAWPVYPLEQLLADILRCTTNL